MTDNTYFRVLHRNTQHFIVVRRVIVGVMASGTFDPTVINSYMVAVNASVDTVAGRGADFYCLVFPLESYWMIIGKVCAKVVATCCAWSPGHIISAVIAAERVQRYGSIVAGETELGNSPWLFNGRVKSRAGVKCVCGCGYLVVPEMSAVHYLIGVVRSMAGLAYFI